MSYEDPNLADLVEQAKAISNNLAEGDRKTNARFAQLEESINTVFKKLGRPGYCDRADDDADERQSAIELCRIRRDMTVTKSDGNPVDYTPSSTEISEAQTYRTALRGVFRTGNATALSSEYQKALSSFSFGTNSFILAPEMSSTVLRCLVEPSDLSGLVSSQNIGSQSVRFLIDNARMESAGWACESSCFANNPQQDLAAGLGELEIKVESLRDIVCVNRDLLEDAQFNIEGWILGKAQEAYRIAISNAIAFGTGNGMPLGLFQPSSGIPICEVSANTPTGQISWTDLLSLKFEIPMAWQPGCSWLMNQRSLGLIAGMSDASGRPLMIAAPMLGQNLPAFSLFGSPIHVVSQMPDCVAGACPIAYGDWKRAYMLVWRRGLTIQPDYFTAGWCALFRFDARVGGGTLCSNAARLLRVK